MQSLPAEMRFSEGRAIGRVLVFLVTLAALLASGCATRAEPTPPAATFRRGEAIEFYEFRLNLSHTDGHDGVRLMDCSSGDFHCSAGVTVLIAPRECSTLRRLTRRRADWRVNDATRARLLFVSEEQLYFASDATDREEVYRSNGAAGFVYDIERGVIGVWRSQAALRQPLDRAAMTEIVDTTKWLEAPRTLFRCR